MSADALLARHAPSDLVAFGRTPADERTAGDLLRDAARVAAALPPPTPGSHTELVFRSDRYAFCAAMLGSWAAGHAVALPPNQRRQTITAVMDRPEVVVVLHDIRAGVGVDVAQLLAAAPDADPLSTPPPLPGPVIATAFTSGSTGAMTAWPKTTAQLLGEALTLAEVLGAAAGSRVVATVGPSHIYGLLFSVLMPLVSGGAFGRGTPLGPEVVAARARDGGARFLITVPAHLRALEALPAGALGDVERIVSSTAPLSEDAARAVSERQGVPITEVFGSTETGGIAHRVRSEGAAWRPLPGVGIAVDPDGRLLVDSPFTDPHLPRPYRTADLAEPSSDGGFLHRGRADGVVKVGGRRVSLRAMEEALQRLDGVDDAAVVAAPDGSGRNQRVLAAVQSTTREPADLRAALAERFEPSTLPRRFRVVEQLPREDNGKLQRGPLMALFGLAIDGSPLTLDLEWGERTNRALGAAHEAVFLARVPEDYAYYAGHFPEYPVMAGVVQLREVALRCVRQVRPDLGHLARLDQAKFTRRIGPGDAIEVLLSWQQGEPRVDFELRSGGRSCSGGRLLFAHGEPTP